MNIKIIISIALIMILASCTKIVEIDLNETDPKIVVDAYAQEETMVDHRLEKIYAKFTKSMSIYEDTYPQAYNNLEVYATNDQGDSYKLDWNAFDSSYSYESIISNLDDEVIDWTIETSIENVDIKAKTSIPNYVKIDSILAVKLPFGPPVDGLSPIVFFTDLPGEANYYRFRLTINGELVAGLFITRDDGFDGKQIVYPFMNISVTKGDVMKITLLAIDEFSFEYYKVIMQNMGGGFTAAPGNPYSNIEGKNTIGIFTGQTISEQTRTVNY